jgi:hypothetical protein
VTNKGRKLDPPLRLDMPFEEAMERFVATKSSEVDESIERSRTKRPPQDDAPRRPRRSKSIKREDRNRKSQAPSLRR